ncbi:MAG: tyrosine-type recombinase/integrase [Actinobacteria bacterium]|nr:tyrosine-type recombinase/integrase [Actinomycetota bacterium]
MRTTAIAYPLEDLVGWERSLMAFLVEKERRSGSLRTVEGYSRMLQDFFGRVGKTPDEVTAQEVFVWAHGKGLSGRDPSPITIGARMACVSSFFRFLMRMEIVDRNPCDRLERPRTSPSPPRGLSAEEIRRLLAVVPDTRVGLRNRALILTLVLTGRRRAEVFRMTRKDLAFENGRWYYTYRGKGGKNGRRELPQPAVDALRAALRAFGRELGDMSPDDSLWPSGAHTEGEGLRSATFYGQLQRYFKNAGLPPAGVHIFRHAAAKLRRDAGESVEEVSLFLDHSSLAVTSVYLRRLEGQEDRGWGAVAEAIGVGLEGTLGLAT